jgi:hypothetical protein
MKTHTLTLAALVALSTLSACKAEVVSQEPNDPQAQALNNAAPVGNLRMIQQSRTYRCKDNSLVYADFYTDNSAAVRTDKDGSATTLNAAEGGKPPFTAEGWSVSGTEAQVSITAPGKGTQSCKA